MKAAGVSWRLPRPSLFRRRWPVSSSAGTLPSTWCWSRSSMWRSRRGRSTGLLAGSVCRAGAGRAVERHHRYRGPGEDARRLSGRGLGTQFIVAHSLPRFVVFFALRWCTPSSSWGCMCCSICGISARPMRRSPARRSERHCRGRGVPVGRAFAGSGGARRAQRGRFRR